VKIQTNKSTQLVHQNSLIIVVEHTGSNILFKNHASINIRAIYDQERDRELLTKVVDFLPNVVAILDKEIMAYV
jgi:hypothetical protein